MILVTTISEYLKSVLNYLHRLPMTLNGAHTELNRNLTYI